MCLINTQQATSAREVLRLIKAASTVGLKINGKKAKLLVREEQKSLGGILKKFTTSATCVECWMQGEDRKRHTQNNQLNT